MRLVFVAVLLASGCGSDSAGRNDGAPIDGAITDAPVEDLVAVCP
jgi:hypothetical protein